jgi:hypothetical protein
VRTSGDLERPATDTLWAYCGRADDGGEPCPLGRRCPSCGELRVRQGWGVGDSGRLVGAVTPAWVCPTCQTDADKPKLTPLFTVELDASDIAQHLLIAALSKQPGARARHADNPLTM